MKLELKHLAAYLPYGLNMKTKDKSGQIWALGTENIQHSLTWWVPILKPLFALPQEIVDMSPYTTHDELIEAIEDQSCPHNIFRICIANGYDVFGLIDACLAIDINTL